MRKLLLICSMICMSLLLATPEALGDRSPPETNERDVLTLAQMCIGEVGWEGATTEECAAVTHVIMWRRDNLVPRARLATVARGYSAVFRGRREHILRLRLPEPERPARLRPSLQAKWADTVNAVRSTLSGEARNPCPGARHWGSVQDGSPGPGSRQVECLVDFQYPERRLPPNLFWSVYDRS